MRIDLHTHSICSDGTDTPARLVEQARLAGLDVVALSDHDTFEGIAAAKLAGEQFGVQVVTGLELSAQVAGKSVHLLGYGCDPQNLELSQELERIRVGRTARVPAICRKLTELGYPITLAEVMAAAAGAESIGRPHVADVLVAKGYVANRKAAFEEFLAEGGPGYVPRYACPLPKAIQLVHGAGGAAVIAHPWGRGRADSLPVTVFEDLVANYGLDGIEVDHQDHDHDTRARLAELAARLGLIPTGSSDYHGSGKLDHELGCNLTSEAAFQALLERIQTRGGSS